MMKWSFQELRIKAQDPLKVDKTLDLKADLMNKNQEVLDLSPVKVQGYLIYDDHTVLAQLEIALTITLPSSRSLEPVDVAMQFPIRERYIESGWQSELVQDEDNLVIELEDNTVDLGRAIVDNIITHIPLKRLTPDELEATDLPSGDDWNLMTEASFQNNEKESDQIDPRFAKLKDLLSDDTSES